MLYGLLVNDVKINHEILRNLSIIHLNIESDFIKKLYTPS